MKKKYKLSNKEIQYIEIALYDELNFAYVSIKTSTIRKLYGLYKDYMRLALEKDDLEIELNKLKRGVRMNYREKIRKALEEPLRQIAINAGLEGAVIVQNVIEEDSEVGFDALNEKYVNMIEAGIVDPTKVTRSALQNAASIAGVFLTTEAAVADIPEKEDKANGMGAGMPGMM